MNLLESLRENPFILAPMAGITDSAYRSFMKEMGAGIVVSELVSATGMLFKSGRTLDLMSFEEDQRPVGIQLFGEDPETIAKAAQIVEQKSADFIDLNFGCPVQKVVKKGAGSAVLKDLPLLQAILKATVSAVKIPVTIKIRTGWDLSLRNTHEVVNIAYNEGITWVAIHGRTRAQGYSGLADWDYIAEVKSQSKVPIIGNGDVLSAEEAVNKLHQTKVDGVMIGRGALKNPHIFREAKLQLNGILASDSMRISHARTYESLTKVIVSRCSEHISKIQLKKFAAWFATGYPGAAQFRKQVFQAPSIDEIISTSQAYFSTIEHIHQEDTSGDGFLMGGHG